MGIEGLLKVLRPSTVDINIDAMAGTVVAIDASCWLHRGAYACAKALVLGQPTDSYVNFFMSNIEQLLRGGVTPLVVFDGRQTLPAKAAVAEERKRKRLAAKVRALSLNASASASTARTEFCQAVEITPEMVDRVIGALKAKGVDYIVAPYEADAQLAFLSQSGAAQFVLTEDADLLVFGAKKVIYKWDRYTKRGDLICHDQLYRSFKDMPDFTFRKFQWLCILSGCDYLKSIHGIGLQRATQFVKAIGDKDIFREINKISAYLGRQYTVPQDYSDKLQMAINTFTHQIILHPEAGYQPLHPYPQGVTAVEIEYAGLPLSEEPVMDMDRTWFKEDMLDTTDPNDTTYECATSDSSKEKDEEGSSEPEPHYTRSCPRTYATVVSVGDIVKWTPPCFPVLEITFRQAVVSIDGQLKPSLFQASDQRVLLNPTPFDIVVRRSCNIVENGEKFVIWKWDLTTLGSFSSEDILSQVSQSTVSVVPESDYMSESDSDGDMDEAWSDSEDESPEPHELPFKVMGVTYNKRYQEVLEAAFIAIGDNKGIPQVDIVAEPDNPNDSNAIAVRVYTDKGPERVGYIQRELTKYVHETMSTNRLAGVRIGKIAFRTTWYHPGWYMKLLIKKLGKWEAAVIQKSHRVK